MVAAASREAMAERVLPGMPLADAQSLLPDAQFALHQPDDDIDALDALACLCDFFSPHVSIENHEGDVGLLMDISGCSHLFNGRRSLSEQLAIHLSRQGYFAHIGIARTIGAAWAIACFGHRAGNNRRLRSLPIESLRLPASIVAQLQQFDLYRIGQLLDLPREELPSRFGPVLTQRIEQCLGQLPESIDPVRPKQPAEAIWNADEDGISSQQIIYVTSDLMDEIAAKLQSDRVGVTRLSLSLTGQGEQPLVIEQSLTQPCELTSHKSRSYLLNLLMLSLERHSIQDDIQQIALVIQATERIERHQAFLFEEPVRTKPDQAFQQLLDRLTSRLGPQLVTTPLLEPEPLPEDRVRYQPAAQMATSKPDEAVNYRPALSRPATLLSPAEPVVITKQMKGHWPESFRWRGRQYHIVNQSMPERMVTGWWRDTDAIQRDYMQCEVSTGQRFWLYRTPGNHWYLHGIFD